MQNYLHCTSFRLLITFILSTPVFANNESIFSPPVFDVHLHYNQADLYELSPQDIATRLKSHGIRYALVTSTPSSLAQQLQDVAPDIILPVLSAYETHEDKQNWHTNSAIPKRLSKQLMLEKWHAIGELHLFAKDRYSPVFSDIIKLAASHKLPLILHADPAVIDRVYDLAADIIVIWAHAGTFPYPDLLADYLQRYPGLRIDLSVRDERIANDSDINDNWYGLFIKFPDRFMTGVDTYSTQRWKNFTSAQDKTLNWLRWLPKDIAQRFRYNNAYMLFLATESNNESD